MKIYKYRTIEETQQALERFYEQGVEVLDIKPKLLVNSGVHSECFYVTTAENSVSERFSKSNQRW